MKTNETNTAAETAAEYTPLDYEDIGEIVADATEYLVRDTVLADDITDTFEVEEYEEAAGTFFIQYNAKTWREAATFTAAIVGQAFALGYFAEPSATWEAGLEDADSEGRLVSVFVAAADFMNDDGSAVA